MQMKLRLSKAQKNSLASEARRTVTALEMMQDDSDAAAASLQASSALARCQSPLISCCSSASHASVITDAETVIATPFF